MKGNQLFFITLFITAFAGLVTAVSAALALFTAIGA
jgi:hypothetical protein